MLVIVSAAGLAAQSSTGGLRGTVKDAQGVIPGATVTLVNEAERRRRAKRSPTRRANIRSRRSSPAPTPCASAVQGFQTFERKGVRVSTQAIRRPRHPARSRRRSKRRSPSPADSPLIETTNASTGGVVDTKTLESIPTAGPQRVPDGDPRADRADQRQRALEPHAGPGRQLGHVDGRRRRSARTTSWSTASRSPTSRTAPRPTRRWKRSGDEGAGPHLRRGDGPHRRRRDEHDRASRAPTSGTAPATRCSVPKRWAQQLLIPKLQNQPNVPRGVAQRRRRRRRSDHQEQDVLLGRPARSTSTTSRSRTRSSCRRRPSCAATSRRRTRNGALSVDQGPADRACRSPATSFRPNRLNPVGAKIASYFPTPDTQVDNGIVELQHDRPAAEQGVPVHDQGRSPLQRHDRAERLLPAPGDARGERELQPDEQVRRRAATSSIAASTRSWSTTPT